MIRDVSAIAVGATLAGWLNQLDTGLRPMIAKNLETRSALQATHWRQPSPYARLSPMSFRGHVSDDCPPRLRYLRENAG
jgi:hypothetical protein